VALPLVISNSSAELNPTPSVRTQHFKCQ